MVSPVLTPGLYTAWDLAGKRPAATSIIRIRIRGRRGKSVAYPIIVESQLYSVCSRPHAVLTAGEAFDYSDCGFEGLVGMLVLKSKKTEIIPCQEQFCARRETIWTENHSRTNLRIISSGNRILGSVFFQGFVEEVSISGGQVRITAAIDLW